MCVFLQQNMMNNKVKIYWNDTDRKPIGKRIPSQIRLSLEHILFPCYSGITLFRNIAIPLFCYSIITLFCNVVISLLRYTVITLFRNNVITQFQSWENDEIASCTFVATAKKLLAKSHSGIVG
ncbi:hypothetical protein IX307_001618 [Bacteroides pyogenes]|nr:hypothetical protein [Bacteroides pyogenes]MBR8738168.1 hypothetical protein [Bacteroides pyogenes]MBR8753839.1 hypothetical protein [Bacteroides pyogenes]MBR8787293.1 hypothetical protein [Bacteroides pyogenes]MBR8792843.1 hypothetical protein [Bacteroides pyogenes]